MAARDVISKHGLVAQAALAASENATDSYGLFWQVETAAPFQAFVAALNNATGLHNRYRARTMVGGCQARPGTVRMVLARLCWDCARCLD